MSGSEEIILNLSDVELEAKNLILKILKQYDTPIDTGKASDLQINIPEWFDANKYKRGQQYFKDNRFGILGSNFCGLILLLAEPNGLQIMMMTEKSSDSETARRRYAETILHTLAWYEYELTKDSKSWKSLNRVRKLHLNASNMAKQKYNTMISKTEIIFTLFGFMGIALIRPHLLGIKHDVREDREAFVHVWAVLSYMIGIDDEINICLYRLETVETLMEIMLRYVFVPIVQFEPNNFKHMVEALMKGLSLFIRDLTYENHLFLARRICGIPGYQYEVEAERVTIIKDIFTQEEINEIWCWTTRNTYLANILYPVKPKIYKIIKSSDEICDVPGYKEVSIPVELSNGDRIFEKTVNYKDWRNELNDSEYSKLAFKDRLVVKIRCANFRYNYNWFGHYFHDTIIGLVLNRIKRWYTENSTVAIL